MMFYDEISGRCFNSTKEKVEKAVDDLNKLLREEGFIEISIGFTEEEVLRQYHDPVIIDFNDNKETDDIILDFDV